MKSNKNNITTQTSNNNNAYYLDVRSIVMFRIFFGFAVIYKIVFFYLMNFEWFSPQKSFFGNHLLYFVYPNQFLSPIDFIQSDWMMYLYLAVILVLALFIIIGFYSKIATVSLYFLSLFFYQRFLPLTFGWDRYYDAIMLLIIFFPLDIKCSINSYEIAERNNNTTNYKSSLILPLLYVVFLIYFIAGVGKNGELWINGSAVGYLLKDNLMTTELGFKFSGFSFFSKILTYCTLLFELTAPFFLFIRYKNQFLRIIFSFSIILFHCGIGLFVEVGFFKYIAFATAILLLPNYFWSLKYIRKIGDYILSKSPIYKIELPNIIHFFYSNINFMKYSMIFIATSIIYVQTILNLRYLLKQHTDLQPFLQSSRLLTKFSNLPCYENKNIPFFSPDWFFYAPNPPVKSSYIGMELIFNNTQEIYFPLYNDKFPNGMPKFSWNDMQRFLTVRMRRELKQNIDSDNIFIKFFGFKTESFLKENKKLQPQYASLVKYFAPIRDTGTIANLNKESLISAELKY